MSLIDGRLAAPRSPFARKRDGDECKTDTHSIRVTLFGKIRDRLAKADIGYVVRVTGRVRQSNYEAEGQTRNTVDLIADDLATALEIVASFSKLLLIQNEF